MAAEIKSEESWIEKITPEVRGSVKTIWSTLTQEQKEAKEAIIEGISVPALYWLMHQETGEERQELKKQQEWEQTP